mgnify:CR=1 FL=1
MSREHLAREERRGEGRWNRDSPFVQQCIVWNRGQWRRVRIRLEAGREGEILESASRGVRIVLEGRCDGKVMEGASRGVRIRLEAGREGEIMESASRVNRLAWE